ncbi:hypothetical protein BGZ57DRAFT_1010450 [Hyaloscypha finlandica]|nr:hypothetical protein BGZ57DRAFT_1010450 [Hyaloscypha finlandica]
MGNIPASDVSPTPSWEFGGAEAGTATARSAVGLRNPIRYGVSNHIAALFLVPDYAVLGDGYSYPDALLLEGNAVGGQPWPAPLVLGLGDGISYPDALLEGNAIGGQPWLATFASVFDVGAFPDHLGLPPAPQQPLPPQRFPCTLLGCTKSFKRHSDRIRHQNTVHMARQGLHLCPVAGCPKSHGAGFKRSDKLTEHLWKKHGDRGYTKRVL